MRKRSSGTSLMFITGSCSHSHTHTEPQTRHEHVSRTPLSKFQGLDSTALAHHMLISGHHVCACVAEAGVCMFIACSSHASNSHAHTCLRHTHVHVVMKQKSLQNTQMELSTIFSPPLHARLLPGMICRCVLGWSAPRRRGALHCLVLPRRFTGSGTPPRCTDTASLLRRGAHGRQPRPFAPRLGAP